MNRQTDTTIDRNKGHRTSARRAVVGASTLVVLGAAAGAGWHLTGAGASTASHNTHSVIANHGPSLADEVARSVQRAVSQSASAAAHSVHTQAHTAPKPAAPKPAAPKPQPQSTKPAPTPVQTPTPVATPSVTFVKQNAFGATFETPKGWTAVQCSSKAVHGFCATHHYGEIWYNPANPGEQVTFNVCGGKQCGAGETDSPHPTLKALFPVTSQVQLNFHEIAFHIDSATTYGAYGVDGVTAAAHMGLELTWPLVTLTVSAPTADHGMATTVLNSLNVLPSASCGG